jgi:hypothetical protein
MSREPAQQVGATPEESVAACQATGLYGSPMHRPEDFPGNEIQSPVCRIAAIVFATKIAC